MTQPSYLFRLGLKAGLISAILLCVCKLGRLRVFSGLVRVGVLWKLTEPAG